MAQESIAAPATAHGLTFIDLFGGCGGFTLGLQRAASQSFVIPTNNMAENKTNGTGCSFKRVAIGERFQSKRGLQHNPFKPFRKVSGSKAVALNEKGTGLTHEKITFAKNTHCLPL